jgi:hypothetical protein
VGILVPAVGALQGWCSACGDDSSGVAAGPGATASSPGGHTSSAGRQASPAEGSKSTLDFTPGRLFLVELIHTTRPQLGDARRASRHARDYQVAEGVVTSRG